LLKDGFSVSINPYGTVFNPISIFNSISIDENQLVETLVERDGGFASLLLHSDIWGANKEDFKRLFSAKKAAFEDDLSRADWIAITLGTAWVYERIADGVLCGNLHKRPASEFRQRLLSVDEIVLGWRAFLSALSRFSKKRIYLTVSPVIHGRNGLSENSLSKSVLRVAAHEMVKQGGAEYFPSLEIIRDELRDYRFYAEDMQHPSQQATDVVYERFLKFMAEEDTLIQIAIVRQLRSRILHRPHTNHERYYKDLKVALAETNVPNAARAFLEDLLEIKMSTI
jgi:hypothetical protein